MTERELSAYNAGKESAKSDSPSCPNPNMTPSEREAFIRGRWAAEDQAELSAPLSWPVELCFVGLFGIASAWIEAGGQGFAAQTRAVAHWVPVLLVTTKLKVQLERQRAVDLGLTPETAPHTRVNCAGAVVGITLPLVLRLLGFKYRTPSWPRSVATSMISELDRRRAWTTARRRATM